jgi:hypothetical protein
LLEALYNSFSLSARLSNSSIFISIQNNVGGTETIKFNLVVGHKEV